MLLPMNDNLESHTAYPGVMGFQLDNGKKFHNQKLNDLKKKIIYPTFLQRHLHFIVCWNLKIVGFTLRER